MSSTFSDRLTAAKDVIKRNHVATSTAKVYARIEERFETFLETVPSDVPEVDKVLVFLNENFNKSPEGFRAATAALRAFYVLKGAVENPLDAEVIKLAGRAVTRQAPLPRHKVKLKAGEFSEAINFLSQSAGDKPRRMMNLLLVSAGAYLRPGEALSLRNDDIEEERGYLKIQIKKDKTNQKGQPRFAWIKDGPQVVPIREWKERAQELKSVWLFPNLKDPSKPWKYDAAAKELRQLRQEGKLPPGTTLHSLRGTAATRATTDGASPDEIARAGRWNGTATLTRCYIEPSPDNTTRAANVLASLMSPPEASSLNSSNAAFTDAQVNAQLLTTMNHQQAASIDESEPTQPSAIEDI